MAMHKPHVFDRLHFKNGSFVSDRDLAMSKNMKFY